MTRTLAEHITSRLEQLKPLVVDVLAERLCVIRQSVKQTCRRLEQRVGLRRSVGSAGMITQVLDESRESQTDPRLRAPISAVPPSAASGRIAEDEVKLADCQPLGGSRLHR